jgi:hypothetical protein
MFAQTWRNYWGLTQDPFSCEDADKDWILGKLDTSSVHSGFDRIYGNPEVPAPGIVFGEKGSGKSGLRLMMCRRLEEFNAAHPDQRVFSIEYVDFDVYLEQFRRSIGAGSERRLAHEVLGRWRLADHLDAIHSIGVTKLADELIDAPKAPASLTRKQKVDLLLLTALYYDSKRRTIDEGLRLLRGKIGYHSARKGGIVFLQILLTALAIGCFAVPHVTTWDFFTPKVWYTLGALLLALTWLWTLGAWLALDWGARRAARSIRIAQRDPKPLIRTLRTLAPSVRKEFILPVGHEDAARYDILARFLGLLSALGYKSCYVLVDRVDEPTALGGGEESMRLFVEKLLDHKLLQMPGLALKLFLPIELELIFRNASPGQTKQMRLDKSNLIEGLRWTGQELYEIANQRLSTCLQDGARLKDLAGFFGDGVQRDYLRETLQDLGTPRYAFGFLTALFSEYSRELPNELEAGADLWRIPRGHFDVVRAAWLERSGLLRRTLN